MCECTRQPRCDLFELAQKLLPYSGLFFAVSRYALPYDAAITPTKICLCSSLTGLLVCVQAFYVSVYLYKSRKRRHVHDDRDTLRWGIKSPNGVNALVIRDNVRHLNTLCSRTKRFPIEPHTSYTARKSPTSDSDCLDGFL